MAAKSANRRWSCPKSLSTRSQNHHHYYFRNRIATLVCASPCISTDKNTPRLPTENRKTGACCRNASLSLWKSPCQLQHRVILGGRKTKIGSKWARHPLGVFPRISGHARGSVCPAHCRNSKSKLIDDQTGSKTNLRFHSQFPKILLIYIPLYLRVSPLITYLCPFLDPLPHVSPVTLP